MKSLTEPFSEGAKGIAGSPPISRLAKARASPTLSREAGLKLTLRCCWDCSLTFLQPADV